MKKLFSAFIVSLSLAGSAYATEWHVLGARAMGMGGAGVAVAEGPVGAYWNPATLARPESPSGVQIPVDAHIEITGQFLEGANDLNDISDACQATPGGGICTQPNIDAAIAKLNHADNGLRADAAAGAHLKIKRLAVFVNNMAYLAGIPKVDVNNATVANLTTLNNSKLALRGIQITEIGGGYGMELPFAPGLMAGANLKILVGKAGYYDFLLRTDSPEFNKFLDNARTSIQPGLDIGVLWDVNKTLPVVPFRPRVGLTSRNINNPKFNNPDQAKLAGEPDKFSLQGNTRMGLAVSPFNFWHLALDADLTRNLTPVDGVASQNVGLGTEVNVFNRTWLNIPLRAGLARNLALAGSKTSYTLGAGFNFLHATVDLAAMVSPARVQIKSQEKESKMPAAISVGVQIGASFGGGKIAAPDQAPEEKK
ncbi:MAG: conjugal transfer protein TraF [Elusimicrobiota bacterium]|jgi:hypothetical protein